jgi:hypothetical protein
VLEGIARGSENGDRAEEETPPAETAQRVITKIGLSSKERCLAADIEVTGIEVQ